MVAKNIDEFLSIADGEMEREVLQPELMLGICEGCGNGRFGKNDDSY